jgi:hypothetical protein
MEEGWRKVARVTNEGGPEVYLHGVTTSQVIASLIIVSVITENPAYCGILLKARIVELAETAIIRERLCKRACC